MTCLPSPLLKLALFGALSFAKPIHAQTANLSKAEAETFAAAAWKSLVTKERAALETESKAQSITIGEHTMPWISKTFGEKPADGRSLWISMHGGGNAPAQLNDQQWQNQAVLYQPKEGLYIAPRAPTNTWNLWHEAHIDALFDRLILMHVVLHDVNPDKVYLMGYSAGGDGVWQLGPRMADRWAAAAMMAGHPNEASILPLRNLPFALFTGSEDAAYDRNKIIAQRGAELTKLQAADPDGYTHFLRVYPGLGHWMHQKDAEALPWMAKFTRNPWPSKVVWVQDDAISERFYWLAMPAASAKAGQTLTASVKGQTISLEGDIPQGLRLRLSDKLLDLDQPVIVRHNGKDLFHAKVPRTKDAITRSLQERQDPETIATAEISL